MALILDTGPLVAIMDESDPDHEACAKLIEESSEPLIVPVCVLVEVEYMLRPWPDAFTALLTDIDAGVFSLLDLPPQWLRRAGELLARYKDLPLGLVDATVAAATEMLGEEKLATLDHRHFSVVKPSHCAHLRLLPQ